MISTRFTVTVVTGWQHNIPKLYTKQTESNIKHNFYKGKCRYVDVIGYGERVMILLIDDQSGKMLCSKIVNTKKKGDVLCF